MKKYFIKKGKKLIGRYYLIALNIVSLIIFLKILDSIFENDFVIKIDILINSAVKMLWNPLLDYLMILITNILSPVFLILLSVPLLIFLLLKRRWNYCFVMVSSLIMGLISEVLIKLIVHRLRPENALIEEARYSFPSGHATISIIFFSFLIYSLKDEIKSRFWRIVFVFLSILIFLLIGASRIYLGVHWPSDVLAGFALGLFWISFLIILFKFLVRR